VLIVANYGKIYRYTAIVFGLFKPNCFGQQKKLSHPYRRLLYFENLLILLMILQRTMMNGHRKELNIGHSKYHQKLENLSSFIGDKFAEKH
jgi:hypothetical protein